MYLTLEKVKSHLNLEPDYTLDDAYIESLMEVAEQVVEGSVNEKLTDITAKHQGELPKPLVQAMLLMIGNFYQNREVVAPTKLTELPFNFQYLINLYKNYNN